MCSIPIFGFFWRFILTGSCPSSSSPSSFFSQTKRPLWNCSETALKLLWNCPMRSATEGGSWRGSTAQSRPELGRQKALYAITSVENNSKKKKKKKLHCRFRFFLVPGQLENDSWVSFAPSKGVSRNTHTLERITNPHHGCNNANTLST